MKYQQIVNNCFLYFLKGLLLIIPLSFTIYILSFALNKIDGLIGLQIPGLGMIIIVLSITIFGYVGSNFLVKSAFDFTESFIKKVPLIGTVYSSFKDITTAFVERKKFDKPVLVTINQTEPIQKIGFVTQDSLEGIYLNHHVAVYLPHSYSVSGDLIIIPIELIKPLQIPYAEVMKFVLSGGMTPINESKIKK